MKLQIAFLYELNKAGEKRMWNGIRSLSNDQWLEEHDYSRGSIHNHIVHVMYATTRWTYALRALGQMPPLEPAIFPEIAPAYQRWQELWNEINSYVMGLSEEQLGEIVPWGLPRRGLCGEAPMWQLLFHLVNHALDHRAQVTMILERVYAVKISHEFYEMK